MSDSLRPHESQSAHRTGETRDSWRAQTNYCAHQVPKERRSDSTEDWVRPICGCLRISCRGMGWQWPAMETWTLYAFLEVTDSTTTETYTLQGWVSSVQLLSRVWLFATPWIAARQASRSITNSRSLLRLASSESVMPSSHLILGRPLLLLPPIPPSIRVFSNELTLHQVAKVLEFQL